MGMLIRIPVFPGAQKGSVDRHEGCVNQARGGEMIPIIEA